MKAVRSFEFGSLPASPHGVTSHKCNTELKTICISESISCPKGKGKVRQKSLVLHQHTPCRHGDLRHPACKTNLAQPAARRRLIGMYASSVASSKARRSGIAARNYLHCTKDVPTPPDAFDGFFCFMEWMMKFVEMVHCLLV
jgi:hypothetical protein